MIDCNFFVLGEMINSFFNITFYLNQRVSKLFETLFFLLNNIYFCFDLNIKDTINCFLNKQGQFKNITSFSITIIH